MQANVDRSAVIQDEFFLRAKREGGVVTIFLTSGKKLTGHIKGFDRFTLILESHRIDQLIFKHAISTVTIGRPGGESGHGASEGHASRHEHAPEPAPQEAAPQDSALPEKIPES